LILVSACLIGLNCRYDGKTKENREIVDLLKSGLKLLPICPEQLGGLCTPRAASQISGGDGFDVINGNAKVIQLETGVDVTKNFLKGAKEVILITNLFYIKKAYLKAKSPSCGVSFPIGVTAAALSLKGIELIEVH